MADVDAKIPELRKQFQDKYSGSILDDTYDERDVKMVKKNDQLCRNVLTAYRTQGDLKKSVDLLNDVLLFRAKMGLNDLKESDLNSEVAGIGGVYFKGTDKNGVDLLHFKVGKQKKGHLVKEGQQFIAFHLNKHYMEKPTEKVVLLFDFAGAGVSNMDLDVTKFIVQCTSMYFPSIYCYSLMFKMGLTLEAVWKVIKGFLDAEQAKKTYFVKRSDIQTYINPDQLEPHMLKD